MKKNNGFTLIELIGVIIIITLLGLLIIPIVDQIIKENQDNLYTVQVKNIEEAAKNWGAENISLLPNATDTEVIVTLTTLKSGGFLPESIVNPKTKEEMTGCVRITYVIAYNQETYEYTTTCS